ncbi:MAG: septal ring lytic transglycosylase RlpA family protein, partial [Gammaproteobacteria bacterium]
MMTPRILRSAGPVLLLGLALTACAPLPTRDGAPEQPPDLSSIPDAVPKPVKLGNRGNPSSYVVFGHTYHVLPSARGYDEKGIASWYGTKFHGQLTSSGEPYDMYAMTAAHKTLPIPTYVRVRNLKNGRSVVVKINDRGPFRDNRLIDLSYAAAVKLGIADNGTGLVEVTAIDPSHPAPPEPVEVAATDEPADTDESGPPKMFLQVGAFGIRDNAIRLKARLERAGLKPVAIDAQNIGGRRLFKVRLGPLPSVDAVDRNTARITAMGLEDP